MGGVKRVLSIRAAMTAVACVSALAAAACASNAPHTSLSGTSWAVESIAGQAVSGPTIEFAEDRVSGTGGCNRFFGGYSVDGDRLTFSAVGSTRMACEEEIMRREDAFFAVLNEAQNFRRDGDRLVIRDNREREVVLRPA
jgi:heat shock protein HslJ